MSSLYERFCEGSLPENFQKDCEGFASVSDSVEEKYFRAGFHCGLHIEEIFTDKDRPSMGREKKEFYLNFLKNLKAELKFRRIGYKRIAPDIGMSLGSFTNKMATCGPNLHKFTFFEAIKIAYYLGVSIYDLIKGTQGNAKVVIKITGEQKSIG